MLSLLVPQRKLSEKESLLKNSKHTLSANIITQAFGMLIFLTIPNILSPNDYAQTVYISVLMSFIVLSDFGMGFVYGRTMPSIYHQADTKQIETYNQTFFWFRLIMSFLGGSIIAIIYYLRYEQFINALLLILLNPLVVVISFFIEQYTVKSDFVIYRNINIKNSIARTLIIPLSFLMGISGWIFAQALGSLAVLVTIKQQIILEWTYFDLTLIKKHFFEGIILVVNFFFWNQLLNSGRLFASMYYEHTAIAQYGLTNAGYTILLSLIISIFLPVTIEALKILQNDPKHAIEELLDAVIKIALPVFILVVLSIEFTPYLFKFFFPKYSVDFEILKYQLLSLMVLPIVSTLGNIFLGLKQPIKLLIIYGVSFGVSFGMMHLLQFGILNAAIAQFIGIIFMGILLLGSAFYFFRHYIDNIFNKLFKIITVVFFPYIGYLLIRN